MEETTLTSRITETNVGPDDDNGDWTLSTPRLFAVVAFGYWLGSQMAFELADMSGLGAVFFVPAGITIGVMLRLPARRWWVVLLAAAVAESVSDAVNGIEATAIAGFVAANTVEPLVGAWIVRRGVRRIDLARRHDVFVFVFGAVLVAPVVGALIGAVADTRYNDDSLWTTAWQWWLGDGLGILLVGGFLLTWGSSPDRRSLRSWSGAALLAGTVITSAIAFHAIDLPAGFVVMATVALAGVVFGARAVAATTLLAGCTVAVGLAWGSRDLLSGLSDATALSVIQAELWVFMIAGLFVAAEAFEARRAQHETEAARVAAAIMERERRDLDGLTDVHDATTRLWSHVDPGEGYIEILGTALALSGCESGRLQVSDPRTGVMSVVAERIGPSATSPSSVVTLPMLGVEGTPMGELTVASNTPAVDPRQRRQLGIYAVAAAGYLERAALEAARHESEQRHRTMIEQAIDGIVVADPAGRFVEANPAVCEMFGYDRDELLGLAMTDLVWLRERARIPAEVEGIAAGSIVSGEWEFIRKDGSTFIGEMNLRGLTDGSVQGFVRDVTDRVSAELERDKTRRRLVLLQQLSAELSVAALPADVAQTAVRLVVDAFGADECTLQLDRPPDSDRWTARGSPSPDATPQQDDDTFVSHHAVRLPAQRGSLELGFREKRDLSPGDQGLLDAITSQLVAALDRSELHASAERSRELEKLRRIRAELVTDILTEIETVAGVKERAQRLLDLLVPDIADFASIETAGDDGPDEANVQIAAAGDADLDGHSRIFVPIDLGGDVTGTMMLGLRDPTREAYRRSDVEFATDVAQRAGIVLAGARLREEEHRIALRLQEALLPDQLVSTPETTITALYRAGSDRLEVGGDWYDSFSWPGGHVGVIVGDVVGHGLDAAAAMGRLRSAVAALAPVTGPDPAGILAALDHIARGSNGSDYVTACCAVLHIPSGTLRYASAGHPPMIVLSGDGTTRLLDAAQSPPLCNIEVDDRAEATTHLADHETLILYSDGLVERRRERFDDGLARLCAEAGNHRRSGSEGDLAEYLLNELVDPSTAEDDVVIVTMGYADAPDRFVRSIPASGDQLAPLRADVRSWLDRHDVGEAIRHDVLLAIGEACANAVEHAYVDASGVGSIEICLEIEGADLTAEISDHGSWRDPGAAGGNRGRGTGIMRAITSRFDRRTSPTGTTVVCQFSLDEELSA